jgi:hypothetical protein
MTKENRHVIKLLFESFLNVSGYFIVALIELAVACVNIHKG